ncbi:hypothetical protein J4573_08490 [Actinomadura barringtoniae]|uniref:Uncharacterized protein n=1 Tax=Actinomadura barringtoniae TaxID=1427535 RepID=A0A939P896_9ACTN|nr:hypothetical protein [Actinomadura barringtoniae]MBO2447122.1 hypothetical protein [Actinomadura barringtoniae]
MDWSDLWFWLSLLAVLAIVFTGPTLIALIRGIDDIGFILLLNAIAFVTLVALPIAYIAAIFAVRSDRGPTPPPDRHGVPRGR